jgi:hypothetical protein
MQLVTLHSIVSFVSPSLHHCLFLLCAASNERLSIESDFIRIRDFASKALLFDENYGAARNNILCKVIQQIYKY